MGLLLGQLQQQWGVKKQQISELQQKQREASELRAAAGAATSGVAPRASRTVRQTTIRLAAVTNRCGRPSITEPTSVLERRLEIYGHPGAPATANPLSTADFAPRRAICSDALACADE